MIVIFILIFTTYFLTISLLIYGFINLKKVVTQNLKPSAYFSIIVPFRNEEKNLLKLLKSISKLNYPEHLFEILVINDDSTDLSVAIFNKWQIENPIISARLLQNIRLSDAPKKDAITTAISNVTNEWIITTDADCVVQANWLLAFDNYIQNSTFEMLAAGVSVSNQKGFLNYYQFVDLLSLQGTTIGSFGINKPFMCNGANFAYTKKLFLELDGFAGNTDIASGDDVFLLQKALKLSPEKVSYLKNFDAIVFTKSEESWSKLFQQRARWASKTSSYDGNFGKILAVIVFITNLFIIIGVFILPLNIWFLFLFSKITIDYLLLVLTNKFFENREFFFPIISSMFYPIFCITVAFYSFFGTFSWKNRKYKK